MFVGSGNYIWNGKNDSGIMVVDGFYFILVFVMFGGKIIMVNVIGVDKVMGVIIINGMM